MTDSSAPTHRHGQRIGLVALFLLALVPRLVAVAQYEAHHPNASYPVIDERSYDAWAREIAGGDWVGDEVFFQEPLYPYFLGSIYSVVGEESGPHVARVLQCLLGALTAVLIALATRQLFGPAAGWVAGGAFALLGSAVIFPAYLLKPNLFLPLLAFIVWHGLRRTQTCGRSWLLFGFACGLGALLRGNMLLLLPVLAAWSAFVGRRLEPALLFVGGVLLVLMPVALRNYAVGGVFALTTSGAGTNLYGGNNADNPYGIAREFDWVRGIPEYEADDWRHEAERRTGCELDQGEVSRFWMGEVWASVLSAPGLHLGILWNKLRATLSDYEVPDNHDLAWDRRHVACLRAPFLTFGVVGPFVLAGLLLALLSRLSPVAGQAGGSRTLALFFLAYLATIVLTVTSGRVRLALLPLGLPLAAGCVLQLARDWRTKRVIPIAVALSIGVWLVHWNGPFDAEERARRLDNRDYNLAVQYLDQEVKLERARELALQLRERHPNSARVGSLWAELEARAGLQLLAMPETRPLGQEKIRAALQTLRALSEGEGLSRKEQYRARRLAGWIQLALENGEAASNHFQVALEFDPEDQELWLGWIQARILTLADCDDTERELRRTEILRRIEEHLDPDSPAAQDLARRARD